MRIASIGVMREARQAGYRPAKRRDRDRDALLAATSADGQLEPQLESGEERLRAAIPANARHAADQAGEQAEQRTLRRDQAEDVPPGPAVGPHDAELDEPLDGAHEHGVGDPHAAHQQGQAHRQDQEQVELAHDVTDLDVELRHAPDLDVGDRPGDAPVQGVDVGLRIRLDVEGRDVLRRSLSSFRAVVISITMVIVDHERARLVEADDLERLAADEQCDRRPSWACRRHWDSRGRSWC